MASKKNENASVESVDVEGESLLDVKRVVVDPEKANADWLKDQAEALQHYKATGEVGHYFDPSRDQEPDIAPEFGVAPHPELFNPPAMENAYSAQSSSGSIVQDVEDKPLDGDDALSEALAAREEAAANAGPALPADVQRIVIVDPDEDSDTEGMPALPASNAPKAADYAGPANS